MSQCRSSPPIKSNYFWPPKKAGIFEFLEFLKVVAYDSTIGPHKGHWVQKCIFFLKYPGGTFSWPSIKKSLDSTLIWSQSGPFLTLLKIKGTSTPLTSNFAF